MTRLSLPTSLHDLPTPCLVLDAGRMERNIDRMRARMADLGVPLRPHLKTGKSIEVAQQMMATPQGPATVSTLAEARRFAQAGVRDIVYAVGITPAKLPEILDLRAQGVDLAVLLDSVEQAAAVADAARESGAVIPALIEIDCDGHRSGVQSDDRDRLLAIAAALGEGGALRGVLTHAGDSYGARGEAALRACAEAERLAVVTAAQHLRAGGHACPVVSVGSTPTALSATDLAGVTEVRAGVYVFFDLVMAGIGVCDHQEIALSVLATVIGHQEDKGWILVDAGWMALSRDRGTASQDVDQGYGLVCGVDGAPFGDLIVAQANQEHGVLALRTGSTGRLPRLAIGDRVRIFPNHACATAAQHDRYHVVRGDDAVEAIWPRFGGW
ncbi:DSD1 family PLP-dependent enzyme [Sphingobium rhizovicinum]|uniref:DSD1 family PLP-dependent enzyme n=1 Tax=Sphingobium rhizovicinum TaxID=432308 RepID=A0ABV7NJ85_9SPHN